MGEYETLKSVDIISPMVPEIVERGRFVYCSDGKFRATVKLDTVYVDGPWINVNVCQERNCFLWHKVYFMLYGIISRNCFNCWKVVFRPKTLDDLILTYRMQLEDKEKPACKSGVERRESSSFKGANACFWYAPLGSNPVLAQEFHKKIEKKIHHLLGVDNKVILKRGCTEMEDAAGPSERWFYPEEQNVFEDLLDDAWEEIHPLLNSEPQALRNVIMMRWIGWAVKNRDKTAEKYYDSLASFGVVPTTVYHDKKKELVSTPMTSKQRREFYAAEKKLILQ